MDEVIEEKRVEPVFVYLPVDENMQLIDQTAFTLTSPQSMVVISAPLMGKTLSAVNVPKFIILDFYKETTYYPFCKNKVSVYDEPEDEVFVTLTNGTVLSKKLYEVGMELRRANNIVKYKKISELLKTNLPVSKKTKLFKALKSLLNTMPFPVVVVDTLTMMQAMNFRASLSLYNSTVEPELRKKDIRRVDKYNGAKYTRPNFFGILDFIESVSPFVIYNAHIREKKAIYEKDSDDLTTVDINLEGFVSSTYTNRMAAVAIFNRTETGCFLDFEKRSESDLGGRPAHLWNKRLKIADISANPNVLPQRYWGNIYVDLTIE